MRHVFLVVACAVLLAGLHVSTSAVAQAPAPRERWEYATLATAYVNSDPSYAFITPDKSFNGKMEEVVAKLGTKVPAGQTVTTAVLMNAIGKDGWELVTIEPSRSQYMGPMFYFKRRG